MRVLTAPNVHTVLPMAVWELRKFGVPRESRNGPVIMSPVPVTTVYTRPCERVVFWPERDANPFFHFYEGLWMLAGRNDVKPLAAFVKQMEEYSDDGKTIHDAYGYRWRFLYRDMEEQDFEGVDQLEIVIRRLQENPHDRRCVVQMWNAENDLDLVGKAFPCNVMLTFQISCAGALDLVVFNRSNDIVWGCYGANAVHFSMLLEYMARRIGVPVGTYTQTSVNWHAYVDKIEPLYPIAYAFPKTIANPYLGKVVVLEMPRENLDEEIKHLVAFHDSLLQDPEGEGAPYSPPLTSLWMEMGVWMLLAHWHFRNQPAPAKYINALEVLDENLVLHSVDWIVAAREWIQRRYDAWKLTK